MGRRPVGSHGRFAALAVVVVVAGALGLAFYPRAGTGAGPTVTAPVAAPSTEPATTTMTTRLEDSRLASSGVPIAEPATHSALWSDLEVEAQVAPSRVRFERLGIDAPVFAVGVDPAGEVDIPPSVDSVGWYRHGPAPLNSSDRGGSAVLVGHVDYNGETGPFFDLIEAVPGDVVLVDLADGTSVTYLVSERAQYPKADLPVDELFRQTGPHQLVLITCGGSFRPEARSYADNIVVVLVPAP